MITIAETKILWDLGKDFIPRVVKWISEKRSRASAESYANIFNINGYCVSYIPLLNKLNSEVSKFAINNIECKHINTKFSLPIESSNGNIPDNVYDEKRCRIAHFNVSNAKKLQFTFQETCYVDYVISSDKLDFPYRGNPDITNREQFGNTIEEHEGHVWPFDSLTNISGAGLFIITKDDYIIFTKHSSNSNTYPNRYTFSCSGTLKWDRDLNPFSQIGEIAFSESAFRLNSNEAELIEFGVDAKKLYFQFSFIVFSELTYEIILEQFKLNTQREQHTREISACKLNANTIIEHLVNNLWEPAAEAALITVIRERFGKDIIVSEFREQKSKWSRHALIDEWDFRASKYGLLSVMSVRYPQSELQTISDDFVSKVLAFIGDDLKDADVIEIGSGIGRITKHLAEKSTHVTCVDVCDKMIKRCAENLGPRDNVVYMQPMLAQDYKTTRKHDIAVCSLVLIHNVNDEECSKLVRNMCNISNSVYLFEDVSANRVTSPSTKIRDEHNLSKMFKLSGYDLSRCECHNLHNDNIAFLNYTNNANSADAKSRTPVSDNVWPQKSSELPAETPSAISGQVHKNVQNMGIKYDLGKAAKIISIHDIVCAIKRAVLDYIENMRLGNQELVYQHDPLLEPFALSLEWMKPSPVWEGLAPVRADHEPSKVFTENELEKIQFQIDENRDDLKRTIYNALWHLQAADDKKSKGKYTLPYIHEQEEKFRLKNELGIGIDPEAEMFKDYLACIHALRWLEGVGNQHTAELSAEQHKPLPAEDQTQNQQGTLEITEKNIGIIQFHPVGLLRGFYDSLRYFKTLLQDAQAAGTDLTSTQGGFRVSKGSISEFLKPCLKLLDNEFETAPIEDDDLFKLQIFLRESIAENPQAEDTIFYSINCYLNVLKEKITKAGISADEILSTEKAMKLELRLNERQKVAEAYLYIFEVKLWFASFRQDHLKTAAPEENHEQLPKSTVFISHSSTKKAFSSLTFQVFLCHNSQDKAEIRALNNTLKSRGINTWFDEEQLPPGRAWQELLEQQIQDIDSAAVIVGESGIGPWQNSEMRAFISEFVNRKCHVIPVILESCKNVPQLPPFLRQLTCVDFRKHEPNPIEQLLWGITGTKPNE